MSFFTIRFLSSCGPLPDPVFCLLILVHVNITFALQFPPSAIAKDPPILSSSFIGSATCYTTCALYFFRMNVQYVHVFVILQYKGLEIKLHEE